METYLAMYVDRYTEEETREIYLIYSTEELEELRRHLEDNYDQVEVITVDSARKQGIPF